MNKNNKGHKTNYPERIPQLHNNHNKISDRNEKNTLEGAA